jgi:hypothetical protein
LRGSIGTFSLPLLGLVLQDNVFPPALVFEAACSRIIREFCRGEESLGFGVPFALCGFMDELGVNKYREEVFNELLVNLLISEVAGCEGCDLFCEANDKLFALGDIRVY